MNRPPDREAPENVERGAVFGAGIGILLAIFWLIPAHFSESHTRDRQERDLWHSHSTLQFGLLGNVEVQSVAVTPGSPRTAIPTLFSRNARRSWRIDPGSFLISTLLTLGGLLILQRTDVRIRTSPRTGS